MKLRKTKKQKEERGDYVYLGWQFKHQYPVDERTAIEKKLSEEDDHLKYENIEVFEEMSTQSQFENITNWLDSQDLGVYESCEEIYSGSDVSDNIEETFVTCLDRRYCSTLKSRSSHLKSYTTKSSQSTLDNVTEDDDDESVYSLQLRYQSKVLYSSL